MGRREAMLQLWSIMMVANCGKEGTKAWLVPCRMQTSRRYIAKNIWEKVMTKHVNRIGRIILPIVVIFAFMASRAALAVQVAQTNVGQVLLAPMYLARATDYSTTKVTVSNTSWEDAVKAMLVVRSKTHGKLLFSTVLYLTPGDTFTGYIRLNASGSAELWSDDDSILAALSTDGTAKFASQLAGGVTLSIASPNSYDDTASQGSIEVIGAYAARGVIGTPSGSVTIKRGMSKFELFKIFSSDRKNLTLSADSPALISSVTPSMLLLRGRIEIRKAGNSDRLVYDMTALEATPSAAKLASKVINNPQFDVSIMQPPSLGENFGTSISPTGDNIVDIETALAAQSRDGFFSSNDTNILVAFPTKYRHNGKDVCGNGASVSGYSPPFQSGGEVAYTLINFDSSGNSMIASAPQICMVSPCPVDPVTNNYFIYSVNYEAVSTGIWQYINGQIQINFVERRGCPYPGVPALAMTHNYLPGLVGSQMTYLTGSTSGPAVQDRIFNWAEKKYSSVFYPPTATTSSIESGYRVYSGSGITLMEKRGRIVIITPDKPGMLQDVGSAEDFLQQARADGF